MTYKQRYVEDVVRAPLCHKSDATIRDAKSVMLLSVADIRFAALPRCHVTSHYATITTYFDDYSSHVTYVRVVRRHYGDDYADMRASSRYVSARMNERRMAILRRAVESVFGGGASVYANHA